MSILVKLILILVQIVVHSHGARILAVFPVPSISHQVVFRPLTQELAKRGHEVIVVTPDPVFEKGKSPPNFTEIDVHDRSYAIWRRGFLSDKVTSGQKDDLLKQIAAGMDMSTEVFEIQMSTPEVQAILRDKSKKFDLVLVEACVLAALGISYVIDAPVIQVSSMGSFTFNLATLGMSLHPLIYPTATVQRINDLSDWEKVLEAYRFIRFEMIFHKCEEKGNAMLKRLFGPNVPSLQELKNNVDMLFVNMHPIWDLNRPTPPNVVYMGGLHQKEAKELPKDLKSYLDSSKNGVIYISFGTNVEPALLPPEKIKVLLNVFSKLPYDILWKWNQDELPARPKNIRISKWLPQPDLLRHPKVKLFITQGGLQSTDEAITAGIPLIGIPLLVDQWYNVEQYVRHNIGVHVNMETITEEKFNGAIDTIINNESFYRNNIAKLRSLLRDEPQHPLDRAVWWAEYVIRHKGAKHLRSPASNMSWTEYLELRIVSYILLALVFASSLLVYTLYSIWSYVRQYKAVVKVKRS